MTRRHHTATTNLLNAARGARSRAAAAAVIAPLVVSLGSAVPARADTPPHPSPALTLTNGSGSFLGQRWALSGTGFAPLATITVELLEVNAAGTVQAIGETQTGLTTSPAGLSCTGTGRCVWGSGGAFSTAGAVIDKYVPGIGEEPEAVDPLQCGHDYRAIALEWVDGVLTIDYATSNVLNEPACL